jgi:hypothetical protein
MYQTGYKGIAAFASGLPFNGGFCKWYYTPRENLLAMPVVDPVTQWLVTEPELIEGAGWYGPVCVPDDQLGFEEISTRTTAGLYYKQRAYGFHPGDNGNSRINLENLPYYEFVVVGKLRAGGLWLVLGTDKLGLQLDADFKSGDGAINTAGNQFAFSISSVSRALILPSFLGNNTTPPADGGGSTDNTVANQTEIIYFADVSSVDVTWTGSRAARFGAFPEIEVWFNNDTGGSNIAWVPITVDAPAPAQTQFTIYNGSNQSGFIILK